jgi:hypothetical protein
LDDARPLELGQLRDILARLEQVVVDPAVVLVGGQAVAGVGIFLDGAGVERRLDVMWSVYGMD